MPGSHGHCRNRGDTIISKHKTKFCRICILIKKIEIIFVLFLFLYEEHSQASGGIEFQSEDILNGMAGEENGNVDIVDLNSVTGNLF